MAELDGQDDIIEISLPAWCDDVKAMSVLWIDFWVFVAAKGGSKTILVDAYTGTTPADEVWARRGQVRGVSGRAVLPEAAAAAGQEPAARQDLGPLQLPHPRALAPHDHDPPLRPQVSLPPPTHTRHLRSMLPPVLADPTSSRHVCLDRGSLTRMAGLQVLADLVGPGGGDHAGVPIPGRRS
eukprot:1010211-Rhodomonas_salina.1